MEDRAVLYTFGCGFDGRLGHGDETHRPTPQPVAFFDSLEIRAVAVGGYHTLVLCTDALYGFGCNEVGQLGVGDCLNRKTPTPVTALDAHVVRSVTAGQYTSYVLTAEGLWSCGAGNCGQLGHSTTGADCHEPRRVPFPGEAPIQAVAVGARHAVALAGGAVYTFGAGEDGQLGHGDRIHRFKPTRVAFFDDKAVTQVAAGTNQSFVWAGGDLYTFGTCSSVRKGTPTPTLLVLPVPVQAVRGIAAAPDCLFVWQADCLVKAGSGRNGQLGDAPDPDAFLPVDVGG
eukprot:EG_transcript_21991